MEKPRPRTKEDLSTVLTQIGAGEIVEVELPTLLDFFGAGERTLGMDQEARVAAAGFANEHNSDFAYDVSAGLGVFRKRPLAAPQPRSA